MKKAFTMIELLVVMVVGAILSAVAVSKIHTSGLNDAAKSIVDDIRYARLLAMGDDVYGEKKDYSDNYYRFTIASNKVYKITTKSINDKTIKKEDYAPDFLETGKYICDFASDECSKRTWILNKNDYKVVFTPKVPTESTSNSLAPTNTIIFNEFGEPLNYNQKPSDFTIELSKNSEKVCIKVEKLTGYAYIDKTCAP